VPLDPVIGQLVDEMARLAKDRPVGRSAEAARASQIPSSVGYGERVARTSDRSLPGSSVPVPVRVYEPFGDGPFPILVFFHGGGWTTCSVDTHDALCRSLANEAGCVVVSVDYRLAPEHKFPIPLEDAFWATKYVAAHPEEFNGLPSIAVGGDSAGGNLAAAVALRARDEGGPDISFQLLAYPAVDYRFDTPSYIDNAEGYVLTTDDVRWFWDQYLDGPGDGDNPYACPLRAATHVGLPPAMIITAEFDPLRDDGAAYAAKLRDAGVPTELVNYDGMIHIHWMLPKHPSAELARHQAGAALRKSLA
jgi:acetyl esterase